MLLPPLRVPCGECFRTDDRQTIEMRPTPSPGRSQLPRRRSRTRPSARRSADVGQVVAGTAVGLIVNRNPCCRACPVRGGVPRNGRRPVPRSSATNSTGNAPRSRGCRSRVRSWRAENRSLATATWNTFCHTSSSARRSPAIGVRGRQRACGSRADVGDKLRHHAVEEIGLDPLRPLSLSHSARAPLAGAGAFWTPVLV